MADLWRVPQISLFFRDLGREDKPVHETRAVRPTKDLGTLPKALALSTNP
jgi:hypothetical protein